MSKPQEKTLEASASAAIGESADRDLQRDAWYDVITKGERMRVNANTPIEDTVGALAEAAAYRTKYRCYACSHRRRHHEPEARHERPSARRIDHR